MKKCDDIRGRLTLYLDNELQGEDRATVESHLYECESCGALFERELGFLNAIRETGPLHVASPELRSQVQQLLAHWQKVSSESPTSNQAGHPAFRKVHRRHVITVAVAAVLVILVLPVFIWQFASRTNKPSTRAPSSFALMAADTHLRRTRGQLPLEMESAMPQRISEWFANKVNFSVKLPNYQELSGQEKLYTLEGARLVGYRDDYAAYVAYRMKARPISLVITSDSVANPAGGEEINARGLTFHYDAIQGLKVITWSDRGLTYALVSDLEERGQESCVVCHQGTKDQDFIAPLKPR
jgi:anti-sigma factor RsiW